MTLSAIDRDALARGIPIARSIAPIISRAIDQILAREGWDNAARYACHYCQVTSLGLMPYETPPALMNLEAGLRLPFNSKNRDREGAELLRRMLATGLSRFEPNVEAALQQAEKNRANVGTQVASAVSSARP